LLVMASAHTEHLPLSLHDALPIFFDANSGGGTVTVDLNAAMSSLNTTGWSWTVAIGVFDFAVGGGIIHAAGVLTIGASTANGLRSEEHTSELQSRVEIVCRLVLEI